MTLNEWKRLENIPSLMELARRLGVEDRINPAKLVHNWINKKSIPSQKNMKKIVKATEGKVLPNDFYS